MSFPRYPEYRDSGVEWLGEIPAHWEVKRVKHVLRSVEQGWSPQCESEPAADEKQWAVLKVGCVNGGRFNPEENKALPPELPPVPELGLSAGDVLVSRANTRELVGSVATVPRDFPRLLLCDKLYRLRVSERDCEPEFLAHWLSSAPARGQIELAATGASASMVNISQGTILNMLASIAPLSEQRPIVDFIAHATSTLDRAVAEQQRLIELLQEKRQAVISRAVTKGLDPDVPMKLSGVEWLGDIPAHWSLTPLNLLCAKIGSGKTPRGGADRYVDEGILFLRSQNVHDSGIRLDDVVYISEQDDADMAASRVQPGDILLNITGASLGRTTRVQADFPAANVNQHVCIIRLHDPALAAFVSRVLQSTPMKYAYLTAQTGAARDGLTQAEIGRMVVPIPRVKEIRDILRNIDSSLESHEYLVAQAHESIALLQERRTALISAAVTGRIDVRALATAHVA